MGFVYMWHGVINLLQVVFGHYVCNCGCVVIVCGSLSRYAMSTRVSLKVCWLRCFYRKEIAEGGEILKTKMLKYLPKIALFNGKGIYEVFCGHKNFYFGLQPEPFPGCPETVSTELKSESIKPAIFLRNLD